MSLKKAGFVAAAVLAAVVALSPLASATEGPHHGHGGKACSVDGGSAGAGSSITGDSLANVVAQVPIGGNNVANAGNCSEFLNDNLNGNLSGNDVAVLGGILG